MNSLKDSRSIRSKALRALAAGLLMSSLSDVELKKLANGLDLEFLDELRELLLSVPLRSETYSEYRREVGLDSPIDSTDVIYERAKARRLSKDRVIGYMREIDPRAAKNAGLLSKPLRELIRGFVARSTFENTDRLFNLVSGQLEQDPYLAGITSRR